MTASSMWDFLKVAQREFPSLCRLTAAVAQDRVAAYLWLEAELKEHTGNGNLLKIIPGFGALTRHPYLPLKSFLIHHGFRAEIVNLGFQTLGSYERNVSTVASELQAYSALDEGVELVCHSLGGVIGVYVAIGKLGIHVKKVIALATPISKGIAHQPLKNVVLDLTGVSEQLYFDNYVRVQKISDKIFIIASDDDDVAPFDHCHIPHAHHFNVSKMFPESPRIGHGNIVSDPRVLGLIKDILNES